MEIVVAVSSGTIVSFLSKSSHYITSAVNVCDLYTANIPPYNPDQSIYSYKIIILSHLSDWSVLGTTLWYITVVTTSHVDE